MSEARLGGVRLACLVVLCALALLPGLGSASRLTYHEALVAQGAREILATGEWRYPTIGGLPWLEKPPLPWWLVAVLGHYVGGVTETVARLPSALAAAALVVAVAVLATRHFGPAIGLLAGAMQGTTAWIVIRGRLAEADVLLACLVTWALVAFDRLCWTWVITGGRGGSDIPPRRWKGARWGFFTLLGASALVKGIGFGAFLIVLVAGLVVAWQRDRELLQRLRFPTGWGLAGALALAWPLMMIMRHGPEAIALWTTHFASRLVSHHGPGPFASEPWWEYVPSVLGQALPWTPLALVGACRSLGRAVRGYGKPSPAYASILAQSRTGDRLLWAWSAGPLILLSLAPIKNAHYAICSQVPWSIWAALELAHLGHRLRRRGWDSAVLRKTAQGGFAALALACGAGFWLLGPWFDHRGIEWAFYESASRQVRPDEPLALLYDDWDRNAYDSAFGPLPHDLAVRLFYLARRADWHASIGALRAQVHRHEAARGSGEPKHHPGQGPIRPLPPDWERSAENPVSQIVHSVAVIGRDRDLEGLVQLGHVEIVARGPALRRDRTYTLFRITPHRPLLNAPDAAVAKRDVTGLR